MEKINNIEISNFKSIKHLKINDCNRINVFIGMPNAGKSNILEALGLFGSLAEKSNQLVRYNKNEELFFEGNIFSVIDIQINELMLQIIDKKNKIIRTGFSNYKEIQITKMGFNDDLYYGYRKINKKELGPVYDVNELKQLKYFNFNKEIELNNVFKHDFTKYSLDYSLGNLISRVPELREEVNKLFKQNNLKLLIDKSSNEIKIFKEYQDGTVFILPYNMIADTLQRLIFYKAAIMSNENAVLLFEEPEAHCFEPYILEFTNSVKNNENGNQFFIVTHSDFIIQEFLRDEESKKDTNIYLVNNVNGETKLKLLDKNKNEDVYELGMNPFFNFENLWEAN